MSANTGQLAKRRRVVITGLGILSPCGIGKEEFWDNLIAGRTFIDRVTKFNIEEFPTKIAGELRGLDKSAYLTDNDTRRFDEVAQYAYIAAVQALKDSGVDLSRSSLDRIGAIVGSSHGAIWSLEKDIIASRERGLHGPSPFAMANASTNITSGLIALKLGLKGPNFSIVSACASGTHSIGEAFNTVAQDRADIMLAGGAESCITPFVFSGYCFLSAMSRRNEEPRRACRPFDANRDGFVMAEGAGLVVLEELQHALERGAHIYAEVIGYGASNDAVHVTNISRRGIGIRRAMQMAIEDANVGLEDIDYINTHGSSTVLADMSEAAAIKDLFKHHTRRLLINSTKSITGHLMGASGGAEAVVCALSLENNLIHPTLNYEQPDPRCELENITNQPVKRELTHVLSNSIGFGGADSSIVIRKYAGAN